MFEAGSASNQRYHGEPRHQQVGCCRDHCLSPSATAADGMQFNG
jgi:hypothetical protein